MLVNPKINCLTLFPIGDAVNRFNVELATTILHNISKFHRGFPVGGNRLQHAHLRFGRDSLQKLDDVGNRDLCRIHGKRLAGFCGPSTDFFRFHAPDFGVARHFFDGAGQNLVFGQTFGSLKLDVKVRVVEFDLVSDSVFLHGQKVAGFFGRVNDFLQIFFQKKS